MQTENYYSTGRRKTAVARVFLRQGEGKILINKTKLEDYVPLGTLQARIKEPLIITNMLSKIDIYSSVKGGGYVSQIEAVRHGIARVLVKYNGDLRSVLKNAGLLTRDPRMKERKKYGRKGARARFQFSKR
jgi:small subunit ribosomal protein S9